MSLPIKSVLIALKRDLERVTLIGVGEISCVYYCRTAGPTREVNYEQAFFFFFTFCSTQRALNRLPRSF